MRSNPVIPLSLLLCLAASGVQAAPVNERLDCMIQPDQDVQLGSATPGLIAEVKVRRGDTVEEGQTVARLSSGVEWATLAVARERAAQIGEARVADSSHNLAAREMERASELYNQQFVSQTYLDKQAAEAQAADGRLTQAEENRRLAARQVQLARAQLAQRTIRAPFAGVVVERYLEPGEFVDQLPVLRIAALNPLRVDVLVPASEFGRVKTGARATVFPEMDGADAHEAVVTTVDRVIDAASNTFRVRLTLPNEDETLPAGLRCQIDLGLPRIKHAASESAPDMHASTTLGTY